ncbi:integrase core domain-containing protein [Streptomyces kaempferi]|uniref:Integrase core domain-containing protein n=1 Tax=Streptomyces kaempferi TaxID=333725 RepID=A0ABW3XU04_9ACTN
MPRRGRVPRAPRPSTARFKAEIIEHQSLWRDVDEIERAVFQWVAWYNAERLHSALGHVPPDEYEQAHWARPEQVPQTA